MTPKQYFQYLAIISLVCVIMILILWQPKTDYDTSDNFWKHYDINGNLTLVELTETDRLNIAEHKRIMTLRGKK